MIKEDGTVKLGDFNRAEFMLYDEENGEYCKYRNGPGNGDVSTELVFFLLAASDCSLAPSLFSGELQKNTMMSRLTRKSTFGALVTTW